MRKRDESRPERLERRQGYIKNLMLDIVEQDAKVIALARHAGKSDEELAALGIAPNTQKYWRVRKWEESRRNIPYALEGASQRLAALMRKESQGSRAPINAENVVVIQLPEKSSHELLPAPVVIEVEPK
jgi:hypothetical protein